MKELSLERYHIRTTCHESAEYFPILAAAGIAAVIGREPCSGFVRPAVVGTGFRERIEIDPTIRLPVSRHSETDKYTGYKHPGNRYPENDRMNPHMVPAYSKTIAHSIAIPDHSFFPVHH